MREMRVGEEIAGYRIDAVVGHGGMGVVYRATQLALDRIVALKVIAPGMASDVQFQERFRREARLAASIKHPNVIAIHDARAEDDVLFISMDYVEGTDLHAILRGEGKLVPARAAAITAQVAAALDAAHARGLVHRDVKPANVLVAREHGREQVYLTDFGLTKSVGDSQGLTAPGAVVGTVDYMAPEQVLGGSIDARTDIYALGCVLYHVLTGRVPYQRETDVAKMYAHATEPAPPLRDALPGAPSALEHVVERAMAKDPQERFASAGEFARAALAAAGSAVPMDGDETSRVLEAPAAAAPSTSRSASFPRVLDPARSGVPIAGRRAELEKMLAAVDRLQDGAGMIALLGEAGMGKTRLAGELARSVHARGAVVLYGRCYEDPLAPYQPFVEVLRLLIAGEGVDWIPAYAQRELARVLPELRQTVAVEPEAVAELAGAARLRLFEEIAATFAHVARRAALLLVLDDLQWADRATLLLIGHLMRAPEPGGLTIVGAYRESELAAGHPLRELLLDLERDGSLTRVELRGLDEAATRALASDLLAAAPAPELVSLLSGQSGGNPFFIEQIVRHLLAAGALEQRPEGMALRAGEADAGVPASVRELIRGRVERLGAPAVAALETAAVCGQTFSVPIVERASHLGLGAALDALESAEATQLIRPLAQQAGQWTFAHALIRNALCEGLPSLRRARLHSEIAQALEAGPAAEPAELALHAFAAIAVEGPERAIRAARLAAGRALRGLAYEEAARYYAQALDALGQGPHPAARERCELLLDLGEAQARAADPAAAQTFTAAAEAARTLAEPELLARAALGRCGLGISILGVDSERIDGLEEALAELGEDGPPALRARLLSQLAIELYYAADRTRSGQLCTRAVELARDAGDVDALLAALNARHVALWTPEYLDERLSVASELVDRAREKGRPEREIQGRNWRCVDLWEAGAIDEFAAEAAAHARLAAQLRLPVFGWYEPLWQAALAALRGDYGRAEELVEEVEAAGSHAGDPNAALFAFGIRLWLHTSVGIFRADDLAEVDARARASPAAAAWRSGRAWLLAGLGRLEEARADLDLLAKDGFAAIARDANWMSAIYELSEAVRVLGDRERAGVLYELLLPFADRQITAMRGAMSFGSAHAALAALAATAGAGEAAESHFQAAIEAEQAWGARVWLVRTRSRYAEFLAARGGAADAEHARTLAAQAVAEAEALHLPSSALAAGAAALIEPAA